MKEKDIHNLIEQQDSDAKQRIWQKVSSQIDVSAAPQKAVKNKIGFWSAIAVALVCIITLSVVLPLTLNDGEQKPRYCDVTQYTAKRLSQTLKQYSVSNNSKLLYIDWYDVAEEVITEYGHMKDNVDDIIFWREFTVNGETGEEVTLSVTDNKTKVDIFDTFLNLQEEFSVNGLSVQCGFSVGQNQFMATFEYGNRIYYLQLYTTEEGQTRLTEIIESMLCTDELS